MAKEPRSPIDWDAAVASATERYPVLAHADFDVYLSHPGLLGEILRDLLRHEHADGVSRNRVTPEVEDGLAQLQMFMGDGYSTDPFPKALAVCTRNASERAIAHRTGISKSQMHRLAAGTVQPTLFELEAIAKAWKRPPEWFAAYRAIVLVQMVQAELERHPERSAALIRRIRRP